MLIDKSTKYSLSEINLYTLTNEIVWNINGKNFSGDDIKSGEFPSSLSSFEKQVLEFGRRWVNGDTDFSILTSGSTGTPKKINFRRDQLEASARLTEKALGLRSGYTALLCLDPLHIAGQMMMVRSLVTGMNLVAVEPTADPFIRLHDVRIDFGAFVPYQIYAILNSSSSTAKLNKLTKVIVGGAAIDAKIKSMMSSLSCEVFGTYGMTETISHIALQKLNGSDRQDFFQVLPGILIATDDRDCLTICAGYLGNEKIVTNDLVEILSPTQFKWLGRIDNVINTGGVKVIPEQIEKKVEQVFEDLGLHRRFFISSIADEALGNKVVLIIEGTDLDVILLNTLHKILGAKLARYEIPKEIKVVGNFVATVSQKINRNATLRLL